jgi:SAM-dependent methyltransferase
MSGLARMRRDWDERAVRDALYYVYTRDEPSDEAGFEESGCVNYNQLVRPFLPILLHGRAAKTCRMLEIGCGVGRMTRWFAEEFGEVHAIDISPEMIERARARLRGYPNVALHAGSGRDLAGLPDAFFDFAFSFIVFQHIPVRDVIENYLQDVARVLRPGAAFKFQLNGDQSPDYLARERDTWLGETFSLEQALGMLRGARLSPLACEGAGTQYFILTARKGPAAAESGLRSYILPGEDWAVAQLLDGWHDPVNGSWRPIASRSETLLAVPEGQPLRLFIALYFWPEDPFPPRRLIGCLNGVQAGSASITNSGDYYLEFPASVAERHARLSIAIDPPGSRAPALRCIGLYRPATPVSPDPGG